MASPVLSWARSWSENTHLCHLCDLIAGQSKSCPAYCVFVGSQVGIQRETGREISPTAGRLVWVLPGFLSAAHSPPFPEHISNTSQTILCSLTLPSRSQNSKAHLKITQKELKDLQWEHEVLEQRFSKVRPAGRAVHPIPSPNLSKPSAEDRAWGLAEAVLSPGLCKANPESGENRCSQQSCSQLQPLPRSADRPGLVLC